MLLRGAAGSLRAHLCRRVLAQPVRRYACRVRRQAQARRRRCRSAVMRPRVQKAMPRGIMHFSHLRPRVALAPGSPWRSASLGVALARRAAAMAGGATARAPGPAPSLLVACRSSARRGGRHAREARQLCKPAGGMRARTSAFLRGLRSQSGSASVVPLSLSPDEQASTVPASPAEPGDAGVYNARAWRMDAQNTTFPEEVRSPPRLTKRGPAPAAHVPRRARARPGAALARRTRSSRRAMPLHRARGALRQRRTPAAPLPPLWD